MQIRISYLVLNKIHKKFGRHKKNVSAFSYMIKDGGQDVIKKTVCFCIMLMNVILFPFFILAVVILWGEAFLLLFRALIVKTLMETMLLINPYLYMLVGIWIMSNFVIYFHIEKDLSEKSRKVYELFNILLYVFIPILVCYLECSLK